MCIQWYHLPVCRRGGESGGRGKGGEKEREGVERKRGEGRKERRRGKGGKGERERGCRGRRGGDNCIIILESSDKRERGRDGGENEATVSLT